MDQELLVDKREPEPGDIVEFPRMGYKHYGIAVGNGYVIHLTSAEPEPPGSHFFSGSSSNPKAKVVKERLCNVAWGNKYRVNNKYDHTKKPREPEFIVCLAEGMVGMEMDYSLLLRNCEHFSTMLRYGEPKSKQAKDGITAVVASFVGVAVLIGAAIAIFKGVEGKHDED